MLSVRAISRTRCAGLTPKSLRVQISLSLGAATRLRGIFLCYTPLEVTGILTNRS